MYRRHLAALATRLPSQVFAINTARIATARCITVRSLSTATRPCSNYRLAQAGVSRQYSSKSYPSHTVLPMPALSPTMTQGNLGVWHKKVGDAISAGDVLVEIETDKAQMDFECQEDGFLAKILVESGTKDVEVNKPIAIFVEDQADVEKFADYKVESEGAAPATEEEPKKAKAEPAAEPKEEKQESAPKPAKSETTSGSDRVVASPLAKSLASQKGISLKEVTGSGPGGRITKADIDAHVPSDKTEAKKTDAGKKKAPSAPKVAPVSDAEYTDIPLTNMRKVIAERLTSSKQTVPHYYLTVEIEMDRILKLREVLNKDAKNGVSRLSVNDFIVKASALALKAVPEANSAWNETSIRQYHNADICIATSTPGGLITPIVRRAETLGLAGISTAVKDLTGRAREGKLQPDEYQGGSFTISNLGMFGIKSFTAIINPPQACILAVGTTEKKVVVAPKESGKEFEERTVMSVTLSSDHRVVDGAVGATWLRAFKGYMEQPLTMLL